MGLGFGIGSRLGLGFRLRARARARAMVSLLGCKAVVVLAKLLCELGSHGVVLADAPHQIGGIAGREVGAVLLSKNCA